MPLFVVLPRAVLRAGIAGPSGARPSEADVPGGLWLKLILRLMASTALAPRLDIGPIGKARLLLLLPKGLLH